MYFQTLFMLGFNENLEKIKEIFICRSENWLSITLSRFQEDHSGGII